MRRHRGTPSRVLLTGGALVGLCLLACSELKCQDVQPQIYTPAPVGVNMLTLGYAFSTGALLFDKTIPVENVTADIHSVSASYSRSIGILGMAGRADVAVPFVFGDWVGDVDLVEETTSRTGFGDPLLRLALFVAGAPALTRDEFSEFQPGTVLGLTVRLRLPLGYYDSDELINLGSNRWTFSPQLGISHAVGRFLLEASAGAWFFTDNDEFLGTNVQSQDPLYTVQLHASYHFASGPWIAASTRQSIGGAVSINEGEKQEAEFNNRVGITMALPVWRRYLLRLVATTGLTATVGNDYRTVGLAWQVLF